MNMGSDDPGINTFRFLAATYPTLPGSGSGSTASSTVRGGLEVGVTVTAGATFVPLIVVI